MAQQLLLRLRDRLGSVINRLPIDFEYLLFVCTQELQFIQAGTQNMDIPAELVDGLQQLTLVLSSHLSQNPVPPLFNDVATTCWSGNVGRPELQMSRDTLQTLLDTSLPLVHLAEMHGISRSTLYRRMKDHNMSVRACYSVISDEELDQKVRAIKARMPHAGYRMVKGSLQAMGLRLQWKRVRLSLQRVDGAGIIARMIELRCIARRSYSVPAPLSLVHIDTNHKLIR